MHNAIQIAKITPSMIANGDAGIPVGEYLASGFNLLSRRYRDSGYGDTNFADSSIPSLLATPPSEDPLPGEVLSEPPLVNLLAIKSGEAVAQLCIFDAHKTTPIDNEKKFKPILDVFRIKNRSKAMFYFGRMASHEDYANDIRLIGGLMHTSAIFAIERDYAMTFAVVNPKHGRFYKKVLGFAELCQVDCMAGMKEAPGVLLYITPAMLKRDNLNRLGRELGGQS